MSFPAPGILHPSSFVMEQNSQSSAKSCEHLKQHATTVAQTGPKCQNRTIADLMYLAGYWMLGASTEGGVLRA
jgi:hypothetical protein